MTQVGGARPERIEDFAGVWQLAKVIDDARGPQGRFAGEARVTGAGPDWTYTERGVLRFDGAAEGLSAERRYLWAPAEAGVEVRFDDGRAFHHLPFAGGDAHHNCPPDTYDVTYDFAGWPLTWRAVWRVTGPRKAYEMTCDYQR